MIAALIAGLILLGFLPFSTNGGAVTIVITTAVVLAIAVVAVLKGKYVLGAVGMLVPPVGLVGATHLAKPGSPWAHRRYAPGSPKLERGDAALRAATRRYRRFQDHVAGAPAVEDRRDA